MSKNNWSPCTGWCKLDERGEKCASCNRTLVEIKNWKQLSEAEQRSILNRLRLEGQVLRVQLDG